MDSSNDADRESKPETMKKMRGDDSRSENADDDIQMTPVDKLCEDELTLIFSSSWLSTQDLLNLRLVNKTWSDAATTTLRRRDACVVELSGDFNQNPPCFYKNGGKKTEEYQLSQLTELISKSKKFPSTNFRIQTYFVTFAPYTHFPDLMQFFELHGDKIKTLGPHGLIFQNHIRDILLIYAPVLEHLDLSNAIIRENEGPEENALKWMSKTLSFKYLTLSEIGVRCHCPIPAGQVFKLLVGDANGFTCGCNYNATDLVNSFLLTTPSKLRSIENVILESLRMVLIQGKGHLIRSFNYKLINEGAVPSAPLMEFVALNPNLTKLTLDFNGFTPSRKAFITSVNGLIQSSKDTVQNLAISFQYSRVFWQHPLLSIPQMKKLNSLTLTLLNWPGPVHEDRRSTCEGCGEYVNTHIDLRGEVFEFKDGISAQNYFPSLMDVTFHSRDSKFYEFSPMSFFSFKSNPGANDDSSANWNCLPKVDILKIDQLDIGSLCRSCPHPTETSLILEVFPNIRILKFRCDDVGNLSSALWALCPNVEFMEMYAIACYSIGGRDFGKSHYVDKFFTGFSDGMLENLRRSGSGLPCAADDLEELKSALKPPSISDLTRLKELKLKFVGKWSSEFASSVTGHHAFSKMENTKFVISYDPQECFFSLNELFTINKYGDSWDSDDDNDCAGLQFSDDENNDDENMGHENVGNNDDWNQIDDIDGASDSADSDDAGLQFLDDENGNDENTGNENDGDDDGDGQNQFLGNTDEGNDSAKNGDDRIAKYEELIFGPIKPYVHIVHEMQQYDMWHDSED